MLHSLKLLTNAYEYMTMIFKCKHWQHADPFKYNSKDVSTLGRPRNSNDLQIVERAQDDSRANEADDDPKLASSPARIEDKPSSSQSRPKEGISLQL